MISTLSLRLGPVQTMADPLQPGDARTVPSDGVPTEAESSLVLVRRAHEGDQDAVDKLFARYLPRLQRWAHGRLPAWARGSLDTHDLVQDTFMQVLQRLDQFEPRHEGAFQGYLRQALFNRVRDEIRRATRRGPASELNDDKATADPSPLEQAIGQETLERYEAALARLREEDREAIILRIELGYPYSEIVTALGKPSVAAAHMAVSRALVRLAEEMSHERT